MNIFYLVLSERLFRCFSGRRLGLVALLLLYFFSAALLLFFGFFCIASGNTLEEIRRN